jgi:hypothetical protein
VIAFTVIVGLVALLSLFGWAASQALFTHAVAKLIFRSAEALEMEERVSAKIDDRSARVINRYFELRNRKNEQDEEKAHEPRNYLDLQAEYERRRRVNVDEVPLSEEDVEAQLGDMPVE